MCIPICSAKRVSSVWKFFFSRELSGCNLCLCTDVPNNIYLNLQHFHVGGECLSVQIGFDFCSNVSPRQYLNTFTSCWKYGQ